MKKVLLIAAGFLLLALIVAAAWKISGSPACQPGYVLRTTTAYDYGLNPNGKFGFGLHSHTACVPR